MNEQDLRGLIEDVRRGKLSRRAFTRAMVALGLTAPLATQMLSYSGVAVAAEKPVYKPTKRGGGGPLKVLWWQGPTLLNPHFAVGTKDQDGSRIFYEPLAGVGRRWQPRAGARRGDPDRRERRPGRGRHVGHLEAEAGREVARRPAVHRRRLRLQLGIRRRSGDRGGRPSAATRTSRSIKVDDYTIRVEFEKPTPFWADAFVGSVGMIIPKHLFERLQRCQVARGAGQPDAGRHRPLPVRRLQAGRPGAGQAQPELSHAEPAVFRHASR